MTVPVTARLDEDAVDAVDQAVRNGLAPSRGALIARAVSDWLALHGEDAIVKSYRRRYAKPDASHDQLVASIGTFSASTCLAADTP